MRKKSLPSLQKQLRVWMIFGLAVWMLTASLFHLGDSEAGLADLESDIEYAARVLHPRMPATGERGHRALSPDGMGEALQRGTKLHPATRRPSHQADGCGGR